MIFNLKFNQFAMKTIKPLFLLFVLLSFFQSVSQDNPDHKQGYYVGEDGKLYWQGGKPVYLFVSENPDGSNPKRLESETSKDYANPMYLDTEGINFIRSQWAVDKDGNYASPKQEVMFEVYNDGTAPKSSIQFIGAKKYYANGSTYYGKNLSITADSKDGLSGVRSILVSQDGKPYTTYSDEIKLSSDNMYRFGFYAVDNVGNVEEPKSFEFYVDVTSPITELTTSGDNMNEILSPRTTLHLNSTDERSGVKSTHYKIDDGSFKSYSRAISLSQLSEGEHKVTYYSMDMVANQESERTYTFYIDRAAPEVVASMEGDQFESNGKIYVSSRSKVKLSATDNKAGVKNLSFQINGSQEERYTAPFELPQTQGAHSLVYFGTDEVNNNFRTTRNTSSKELKSINLDLTAPTLTYRFDGNSYASRDTSFVTSETEIVLTALDKESGLKEIGYTINGGTKKIYSEPFNIVEEGFYVIEFTGQDQVNNAESMSFSFVVDNTGPKIETILSMEPVGTISLDDLSDNLAVYSAGVKLYLGATDGMIDTESIYFSFNDENEKLYTKPVSIAQKGMNSFKVRALDKLGNETQIDLAQVFIK